MKVRNKNVATFYQIACMFNFSELVRFSLCYIERFFPIVFKKINFKNLSFDLIAKIASSSDLNTDSEIEVINAINLWISHNFEERSKFASRLLSKVRLNLLSFDALKSILESNVSFIKIDDCVAMLKNVLINKISLQNNTSRYCSKNMFSILLSGGYEDHPNGKKFSDVTTEINAKNLNIVKDISTAKIKRVGHRSVYCRGAVYVFGGSDVNKNTVKPVEKFSLVTNKWKIVSKMFDDRICFDVCRFMEHVFIIGGCDKSFNPFYSCKRLDTKDNKWYKIAKINKARIGAASTVYEERIVVSGGSGEINNNLNTVEAYDPLADSWSSMPNMIKGRCCHGSVAVRNKLFVIGSYDGQGMNSCEVFDSSCKKFVLLKQFPSTLTFDLSFVAKTFSIGNKLVTIGHKSSTVLYYDVEKDKWSEETLNITKNKKYFSCTFIPHIKF